MTVLDTSLYQNKTFGCVKLREVKKKSKTKGRCGFYFKWEKYENLLFLAVFVKRSVIVERDQRFQGVFFLLFICYAVMNTHGPFWVHRSSSEQKRKLQLKCIFDFQASAALMRIKWEKWDLFFLINLRF